MTETVAFKYRAFLSYSHRDRAWCQWLHKALEGFRVDKDLVGRPTPVGTVPKTLRPIFRDREDFSAGHSLTEQTLAALDASQFLIVLCSPNAAKSRYVNEEIRRFKAMGRADRVIPVIVDGEPGDPDRECFPAALRYRLGPDHELTDQLEEPIAADARPQGDGKEAAKQKVAAGLLGLGLDEIVRRAERARVRRNRFWSALAGIFLVLAVVATASTVYAYQKLVESDSRLDQAIEIAYGFVTEATDMSDRFGVPSDVTLSLLQRAEAALNGLIARGADSQTLRYRKSLMLLSFANSYRSLGKTDEAAERANDARILLAQLVSQDPRNIEMQIQLASAHLVSGELLESQRNLSAALTTLRAGLAVAEHVPADDPSNAQVQPTILRILIGLRIDIGDVLVAQSSLSESMENYNGCFDLLRQFAKADSTQDEKVNNYLAQNPSLLPLINIVAKHLAQVLAYKGEFADALDRFQLSLKLDELLAANSQAVSSQVLLEDSIYAVGNALLSQGDLDDAMAQFRRGLDVAEGLVKADPKNYDHLRFAIGFKDGIGRVLLAQGQSAQALAMFRANSSPFLLSDTGNGLWQGYAAIGHERVADALLAQAELGEAGDEYRKELAILAPLVESNPTIERKIFLAGAHFKLGEVLQRQALLPDATEHFNQSLAITEPLGSANPEFIGYQVFMQQTRLRISQANDRPGEAETTLGSLHKLRDERRLTFEQRKWLSDIDGSPKPGNSGTVKITHVYDASGKETERAFVGADGKPTPVNGGYARLTLERDSSGREIRVRYFDAQDQEIPMELMVLEVQPNSTAERIGLKAGDRILSYDGKMPTSTNQFTDLVTDATGASSRTVVVRRDSQSLIFTVPPGRLGINIDMTQAGTASGDPAQDIAAPPPIAQAPTQK